MQAGRNQEIPCAFGRRRRQDGRLILQKALPHHALADRGDHAAAQYDVPVQGLAAQVEIAVLQADFFRIFRLAEDRQRQFGGFGQNFDARHAQLDLACGQVGVHDGSVARHDLAVDPDHALGANALDGGKPRRLGVEHQLGQTVVVTQIDEQQAAVVALPVHPARQPDIRSGVRRPEGAAGVGTIGVKFGHRAAQIV